MYPRTRSRRVWEISNPSLHLLQRIASVKFSGFFHQARDRPVVDRSFDEEPATCATVLASIGEDLARVSGARPAVDTWIFHRMSALVAGCRRNSGGLL